MNRNLEVFKRDHFHGDNVVLQRLPVGRVNLVIPEECIDRSKGRVDLHKLEIYLKKIDNIQIEYEVE